MHSSSRRACGGPGCLVPLLAVALWLPQVVRAAGLIALGRTPPTAGLVVTTSLLILSLSLPLVWRTWRQRRQHPKEVR